MNLFKEKNGEYSWRKILTALIGACYAISHVGHSIDTNFSELPMSYIAIDGAVIMFYFSKDLMRNIKLTGSEK
jgi:hypothetical protein